MSQSQFGAGPGTAIDFFDMTPIVIVSSDKIQIIFWWGLIFLKREIVDCQLVAVTEQHRDLFCDLYSNQRTMHYIGAPLSDEKALKNFQVVLRLSQQSAPRSLYRVIEMISDSGQMATAGFVRIKKVTSGDAAIIGVMLQAEYQGKGVAYQAHKQFMAEANHMGYCQAFKAYCHLDNQRAHRLYQRLGFHKIRQLIYHEKPAIEWRWGI